MTQNDFAIIKLSDKNRKIIKSVDSDITYFTKYEIDEIIDNLQYSAYSSTNFSTIDKLHTIAGNITQKEYDATLN